MDWVGTSWIVEVKASGTRDSKSCHATHLFPRSAHLSVRHHLRTAPEALLQLIRERWSIESWYWIRDTQLHEDKHHNRGNGARVLAAMRTAALNLLPLDGFDSIRESLHAVMYDIRADLAMTMQQPREPPS